MKQADGNPWDDVDKRFPPGTLVEGMVRNLTSYGAFIEIEDGIDGLLHVSDMSWTKKIANPAEVMDKGSTVRAVVLSVHPDKKRIALGLKQLELDPWQKEILEKFKPETEHAGAVTKVTNFGIFVQLDQDLEGLLHISELTPADNLQPGDAVAVKVLRLDTDDRKIALTLVRDEEIAKALLSDSKAKVVEAAAQKAIAAAAAAEGAEVDTESIDPTIEDAEEASSEATEEAPAEAAADETPRRGSAGGSRRRRHPGRGSAWGRGAGRGLRRRDPGRGSACRRGARRGRRRGSACRRGARRGRRRGDASRSRG